jgi:hypothetical protein
MNFFQLNFVGVVFGIWASPGPLVFSRWADVFTLLQLICLTEASSAQVCQIESLLFYSGLKSVDAGPKKKNC